MKELIDALNDIANAVLNPHETPKRHIRLSPDGQAALGALIRSLQVPKGTVLVEPGRTCTNIYFIRKGFARIFYYKDGKDITEAFRDERTILHSAVSLITKKPDKRGIELIEDAELLYMNYLDFEKMFDRYPEFEHIAHVFTNISIILLQKRLDGLLFETASSRYQKLLAMYPGILHRLPLGMIASYLGITQETLSRIRASLKV